MTRWNPFLQDRRAAEIGTHTGRAAAALAAYRQRNQVNNMGTSTVTLGNSRAPIASSSTSDKDRRLLLAAVAAGGTIDEIIDRGRRNGRLASSQLVAAAVAYRIAARASARNNKRSY